MSGQSDVATSGEVKPPLRLLRSAAAIFLGFAAVVVLSLGTDQVLHMLDVYPPWGERMDDARLLLLALAYRTVYTVLGGYIAARLAPGAPMRHAVILGLIGLIPGIGGVIAAVTSDLGPLWFPVVLALAGLPCCWLGGVLHRATQAHRQVSHPNG
ncbi:MAG: hypothetical protein HY852_10890 [Bradyrhizobium sp.]|uniref:hypothetical protein n=1 Tax=Bradyrhizobium sp. TaxID=376 RepID=UPI0025BC4F99|nr:hypothetical protein [Bradyrhizobium sp.]MBI5262307.1 hypothetical protein [Bradyrhizobium sp.]